MVKNKALEEIQEQLDQGIQEVMTSEKFQEWLQFLSSLEALLHLLIGMIAIALFVR
ncbi:hypothetical protein LIT25_03630 [Bacillus sp. F19]|nr:hypothetical protein LIT25_03630 [Bacillus sp. F19]